MFLTYQTLKKIAEDEFSHIVRETRFIGGRSAEPNKLRMYFIDDSFLDVWLSEENDYSYHWEQRGQRGLIHRWDNAPDHPEIESFPDHFHDGIENNVLSSELDNDSIHAFRHCLSFPTSVTFSCWMGSTFRGGFGVHLRRAPIIAAPGADKNKGWMRFANTPAH